MADGQRDQMLVDFQECTQIEDIETCIDILEQNGWHLMNAIQSVMPHADGDPEPPPTYNSTSQSSVSGVSSEPVDVDQFGNNVEMFPAYDPCSASGPYFEPTATTSFASRGLDNSRMLNFTIEYRGKTVTVNLLDTEKVVKIKECIKEELHIPIDKQDLRGWPSKRVDDKKALRELYLPRENTLYLLTPELNTPSSSSSRTPTTTDNIDIGRNLSRDYTLHVTCHDNDKEYKLNFAGSKTVGEVKSALYHLTNIQARHQVWTGWPDSTGKDDSLTIGACDLQFPEHKLTLTKANIPTTRHKLPEQIEISDDEDEGHDHYSIEEDLFEHDESANNRRQTPLIPASVENTTDALEHFTREFRERYGETHPVFFVGSLDDALREALMGKAKDRKLLAVYLHHDNSILSNVFCSQILCQESIVSYLCNNFITWAWDMTHDTNSARFVTMATRHFGSVVAGQVRFTKPDQLPVLLVISRARATNEVVDMIQGSVTLDELMMRLMQVSETFHSQQLADIKDEEEREARENIRQEQELAFQQSLAADRAKAEAQRLEHEKEMQQQMEDEQKKREEEDRKQALQESAAMHIQEEPPESCKEEVSRLRMRTPKGGIIQRRFYASEKLKYLIYYITSQGFHTDEYKILTTFPRRDLSQLDEEKSLKDLNIYPQETLILEERH